MSSDSLNPGSTVAPRVLNVGGNNKNIPIPEHYAGWEDFLLDIDLAGKPDIHLDALDLKQLSPSQYDAVYCSHNLEHFFRAEVPVVLEGMFHVLKEDGFVEIVVPDFSQLIEEIMKRGLDISDTLYECEFAPITVHDYLFGYEFCSDSVGRQYCLHKTAFTQKSLEKLLKSHGFPHVYIRIESFQLHMLGFKRRPQKWAQELLRIEIPI